MDKSEIKDLTNKQVNSFIKNEISVKIRLGWLFRVIKKLVTKKNAT